jgi:hypothetical protein
LHGSFAVAAVTAVDPEVRDVRPNFRDLGLVLIEDLLLLELWALAVRTGGWKRNVDDLVDVIGNHPASSYAVRTSWASPRSAGLFLGRPLGERRRLALARPQRSFELPLKATVVSAKFAVLLLELLSATPPTPTATTSPLPPLRAALARRPHESTPFSRVASGVL